MKAVMQKLRRKSGFSLAETLVAILILLMVASIVAGAIPAASRVFTKTVDSANAQVLLSTAMTVLRDELGTATDIHSYTSGIVYKSGKTGNWCKLYLDNGVLMLKSYPKDEQYVILGKAPSAAYAADDDNWKESRELISQVAATKGLKLSFDYQLGDNYIQFTGLTVKKQNNEDDTADKWTTLTEPRTLTVRSLKK